jgi:hypothetical protein
MRKLIMTAVLLLASAGAAAAAVIPVTGSYTISYSALQGNGPSFVGPRLPTNFTENLTVGTTTTATQFFGVSPANTCGATCINHTAKGTITVNFNFTAPTTATASASAAYMANYSNETDSVIWNNSGPLVVNFTDGSILDIFLIDAEDWTIYPYIKFKMVQGPTTRVPEPGTLAVAAFGLLGLAFFGMRAQRRARAVA